MSSSWGSEGEIRVDHAEAERREPAEPRVLDVLDVLAGGGDMGALMRALDWSRSPVGQSPTW